MLLTVEELTIDELTLDENHATVGMSLLVLIGQPDEPVFAGDRRNPFVPPDDPVAGPSTSNRGLVISQLLQLTAINSLNTSNDSVLWYQLSEKLI